MRYLLVAASLLLASCAATSELPSPTPADKVIEAAGLPSVSKLVIRGPVTIQVAGPGSTQHSSQADNRKAGQKQGAAATAPDAQVEQASKRSSGPAWYIYALVAIAGAVIWDIFSQRLGALKWLPWRRDFEGCK